MTSFPDNVSMALFCDFENVALGVRDAQYDKFDIKPILERLLLKGSIVVKKAYCDWERYKGFKATMHEANFELIEIPHVRQSGKNSADIRLVLVFLFQKQAGFYSVGNLSYISYCNI